MQTTLFLYTVFYYKHIKKQVTSSVDKKFHYSAQPYNITALGTFYIIIVKV